MNHHHRYDPHRRSTGLAPQIPTDGTATPREGPLRIVAWVDRYMPYPGSLAGGERALHGLLRWLAARGHEVRVASPVVPTPTRIEDMATVVYDLDGVQLYPEGDIDWLLGECCDVLLSQLGYTKITRAAAISARIPYVYLFHNDFTIPHWRLHPDQVTAVVYNTNWIRESILGRHPQWTRVPAATVRPPVSVGDFTVDTPGNDREFVTLVNPNQAKGGPIFYQLAEQRPETRFLAVEGAYGQQMRPKERHRNVEWQRQTPDMRGDVYARTRVLVVPSEYESFGCVAVEAAAAGCAVIASQTKGLTEALGGAARFAPMLRGRRAAAPWLAELDALDDPETYDATVRALAERAKLLESSSQAELLVLEDTLRFAANAKRVGSRSMAPRYDPHRRHAKSVEVPQAPTLPAAPPEAPPVSEGAGEVERLAQAGVTDPDALATARDMDTAAAGVAEPMSDADRDMIAAAAELADAAKEAVDCGAITEAQFEQVLGHIERGEPVPDDLAAAMAMEREAPGTGVAMEAVEVAPGETGELTSDGSGAPLPPADGFTEADTPEAQGVDLLGMITTPDPRHDKFDVVTMDTQQGAGVDGSASGGDAGSVPSGAVDSGDGADSQDVGRTEPEPAPNEPDEIPRLVDQVPPNATGDDGIVAWIEAGLTPAEIYDRAEAAEYVENQRPKVRKKKRKAVVDAVGPILYEDDGTGG